MKRAEIMSVARKGCDARCINHKRGMGRRAKRQGAKKLRQHIEQQDRNHDDKA